MRAEALHEIRVCARYVRAAMQEREREQTVNIVDVYRAGLLSKHEDSVFFSYSWCWWRVGIAAVVAAEPSCGCCAGTGTWQMLFEEEAPQVC